MVLAGLLKSTWKSLFFLLNLFLPCPLKIIFSDVTLDARVDVAPGTGNSLTIDLGGYTITREGTSGNGSAFDVKSGSVVITNGVIDCTQDDTAIAQDGVYAITSRSGSNVTLADCIFRDGESL